VGTHRLPGYEVGAVDVGALDHLSLTTAEAVVTDVVAVVVLAVADLGHPFIDGAVAVVVDVVARIHRAGMHERILVVAVVLLGPGAASVDEAVVVLVAHDVHALTDVVRAAIDGAVVVVVAVGRLEEVATELLVA